MDGVEGRYDVVIAGLGPTGLLMANLLGQSGLRALALERDRVPYGLPRAVGVDDEGMRAYQSIGLDQEMAKDLVHEVIVKFRLPGGNPLLTWTPNNRSYWDTAMVLHYQPTMEEALRRGMKRFANVDVRMGCKVIDVCEDAEGVSVKFSDGDGDAGSGPRASALRECTQSARAGYLVACDGGRSVVREMLGVKLEGAKYPDRWLVIDVRCPSTLRSQPYFNFHIDPGRPHGNIPQPNGHHRFEFMVLPDETKEQMEDIEVARRLISKFVNPDDVEILRNVVYSFNALVAERWRIGRVLLCGDAAHMNPQFFGQGQNAGIRDASNLAWKLALVVKGDAKVELLDTYHPERVPHYLQMLRIAVLIGRVVSIRNPFVASLRNLVVRAAVRTPLLGRYIREVRFKPKPQLPANGFLAAPSGRNRAEGKMLIQPRLRTLAGQHARLDDLLGYNFAIIGYCVDPRTALAPADREFWDRLATKYVCAWPLGERPSAGLDTPFAEAELMEVECLTGALDKWFTRNVRLLASAKGHVAVVRPDRYVLAQRKADQLGAITARMRELVPGTTKR
jgi:3-(3-hydroxy-phenyl)propionate hydroxylase